MALDGEIFDQRFHSFREDAELCFRLRERGWEILYEPRRAPATAGATCPSDAAPCPRRSTSTRSRTATCCASTIRRLATSPLTLLPALARDLVALGYVLLREPESRRVYAWLWRRRAELLRHRRAVRERRTAPRRAIERWFFTAGTAP